MKVLRVFSKVRDFLRLHLSSKKSNGATRELALQLSLQKTKQIEQKLLHRQISPDRAVALLVKTPMKYGLKDTVEGIRQVERRFSVVHTVDFDVDPRLPQISKEQRAKLAGSQYALLYDDDTATPVNVPTVIRLCQAVQQMISMPKLFWRTKH